MLAVELEGESMQLHHERALYWMARQTLIVADTHFGKDGIFREHAIPIPEGTVNTDLQRLTALIEETGARRLLVLGDFIHGYMSEQQPFIMQFECWRSHHRELAIDVVLGNHDRRIRRELYSGVGWHEELAEGPFLFVHEPREQQGVYVLAGHIHPVMRLKAGRGDRLRLPVFWFSDKYGTLPSFGSMTGGYAIKPAAHDRLYAVGPDAVMELA